MTEQKLSKIFAYTFVIFSLISAIFWVFFSNTKGYNTQTEQKIAHILNNDYKQGDYIFIEPSWDIGFTNYLRDGITNISYTLKAFNANLIASLTNKTGSIYFILPTQKDWQNTQKKYNLNKIKEWKLKKAIIVKAVSKEKSVQKLFDFFDGIMQAKEVYLQDLNGKKHQCLKKKERWQCSYHQWNYVGDYIALMGGVSQKAIWSHPRSRKFTNIVFDSKNASKMVLGTAFLERAYHEPNGKPIKVSVYADNKEILKYTNENKDFYYRHTITLPKNTKTIRISFYVENDGARHFVFNGYLIK